MAATVRPLSQAYTPAGLKSHRERARLHAIMRGTQRGPRPVTSADVDLHEDAIICHQTRAIRFNGSRELHVIEDSGAVFYAIWCRSIHAIVTYLRHPGQFLIAGRGRSARLH